MDQYEMVKKAVASVRSKTDFVPEIAVVLGSGLGALAECVENPIVIPAAEIEGSGVSTVSGHAGLAYDFSSRLSLLMFLGATTGSGDGAYGGGHLVFSF